jgi:hypothetical protein
VKKGTIWVYHRPGTSATVHWFKTCPRAQGGPPGSRMLPLDVEWQKIENLTDARPSVVVTRAQAMFAARVCTTCIPQNVLDHLNKSA